MGQSVSLDINIVETNIVIALDGPPKNIEGVLHLYVSEAN